MVENLSSNGGNYLPRVMIAGTGSGCGKTTIVCGILKSLKEKGMRAGSFKCGPDYIDPMYHSIASGSASCNLDPWFFSGGELRKMLGTFSRGKDLAVIEGVMGYYDGMGFSSVCSSAEVARSTDTPVVLVVDCAGAGHSALAVLKGFLEFEPDHRIRGVIFNRMSAAFYDKAADYVRKLGMIPMGFVPRKAEISFKSRHLGLVVPGSAGYNEGNAGGDSAGSSPICAGYNEGNAGEKPAGKDPGYNESIRVVEDEISRISELVSAHVDLDALVELARSAEPLAVNDPEEAETFALPGGGFEKEEADGNALRGGCSDLEEAETFAPRGGCSGAKDDGSERSALNYSGGGRTGLAARPKERAGERRLRVGLASDEAFCFFYPQDAALLEAENCELVRFSPLRADQLPNGLDALILPGGYPELYAKELSEKKRLLAMISEAVAGGMPCIAECGGFMLLTEGISAANSCEGGKNSLKNACGGQKLRENTSDLTGRELNSGSPDDINNTSGSFRMAGVVGGRCFDTGRLRRFGYVEMTARTDGLLAAKGQRLAAHEFHYWDCTEPGDAFDVVKASGSARWTAAHVTPTLYAGFPHVPLSANREAARRFLKAAEDYRLRRDAAELPQQHDRRFLESAEDYSVRRNEADEKRQRDCRLLESAEDSRVKQDEAEQPQQHDRRLLESAEDCRGRRHITSAIEILRPEEIERRSFEIIRKELGRPLPPEQEPVILRVIHTTADLGFADTLRFSEGVTGIIREAVMAGADIVTDTQMVLAGINKKILAGYGGSVRCYMSDEDVAAEAKRRGVTRAAVSMEKAAAIGGRCIFAIGNAPTALIRIRELFDEGLLDPVAVIGVPVGFVNVEVSKELILGSGIPHIVAAGRKGGSPVAAAIANAIIYQCK